MKTSEFQERLKEIEMETQRATQKERKLAAKMFNAGEARQRVEDLEINEETIFQDTLFEVFDRIEHAISEKSLETEIQLSNAFPVERISNITKVLSDLNYSVATNKKSKSFYLEIGWS